MLLCAYWLWVHVEGSIFLRRFTLTFCFSLLLLLTERENICSFYCICTNFLQIIMKVNHCLYLTVLIFIWSTLSRIYLARGRNVDWHPIGNDSRLCSSENKKKGNVKTEINDIDCSYLTHHFKNDLPVLQVFIGGGFFADLYIKK